MSIAFAAVSVLLAVGALVGLAAPKAVANAASPNGGAGRAVYCPAGAKKQRQGELNAFVRTMAAARKKYFAAHPKPADRTAFLRSQQGQLHSLQRALAKCG